MTTLDAFLITQHLIRLHSISHVNVYVYDPPASQRITLADDLAVEQNMLSLFLVFSSVLCPARTDGCSGYHDRGGHCCHCTTSEPHQGNKSTSTCISD